MASRVDWIPGDRNDIDFLWALQSGAHTGCFIFNLDPLKVLIARLHSKTHQKSVRIYLMAGTFRGVPVKKSQVSRRPSHSPESHQLSLPTSGNGGSSWLGQKPKFCRIKEGSPKLLFSENTASYHAEKTHHVLYFLKIKRSEDIKYDTERVFGNLWQLVPIMAIYGNLWQQVKYKDQNFCLF